MNRMTAKNTSRGEKQSPPPVIDNELFSRASCPLLIGKILSGA